MPCPHYRIKISTRSKAPPTTAQAAYQSGERLYDERTHRTKDYNDKRGVIFTEIMLPDNAPREYHHLYGKRIQRFHDKGLRRGMVLKADRSQPSGSGRVRDIKGTQSVIKHIQINDARHRKRFMDDQM